MADHATLLRDHYKAIERRLPAFRQITVIYAKYTQ
jgi:hypothetical protein